MNYSFSLKNLIADVWKKEIYPAEIIVEHGKIKSITKISETEINSSDIIIPGFIDSHIHIESSMLIPSEFARLAVVYGTVGTVSDPHEIANVCGMKGVEYMIENGNRVPFKFNFGAPSCVPATTFETSGDTLDSADVEKLLERKEIKYLSEMMNFPGVLFKDAEVMKKIQTAHRLNKPVDGHAPGLRGEQAKQYIDAGISTDHECFTADEALDKLKHGMKIIIREGSAAKNFEALIELMNDYSDRMMFCSDDKHPDSLTVGHINQLCQRSVAKNIDVFKVLQAACVNPVLHYKLDIGLLRVGDDADFILVNNLKEFKVSKTFINGELVAENGISNIKSVQEISINKFSCNRISVDNLKFYKDEIPTLDGKVFVIEAMDGQLITNKLLLESTIENDCYVSNTNTDILKMVVINRYHNAPIAKAFIKNFGFKKGAIASTVAHDSHNIVAVGVDNESLCIAINKLIECEGGVSVAYSENNHDINSVLPLPVAGLMSTNDGYKVAAQYTAIDKMAKDLGSTLSAPFMTLSFMALLVIPHLKLSDLGLFDGDSFSFVK